MREHRYTMDMPHSAARLWALFQDYDSWTTYAPMVLEVEVVHPGDQHGNGLLRRVIYQMPLGPQGRRAGAGDRRGQGAGLHVHDAEPQAGQRPDGQGPAGAAGPEPDPLPLRGALPPDQGPVEVVRGPDLQVHQQEERGDDAGRRPQWLTDHPEYRPDLVASEPLPRRCRPPSTARRGCWRSSRSTLPAVGPHDVLLEVSPLRRVRQRPAHGDGGLGHARCHRGPRVHGHGGRRRLGGDPVGGRPVGGRRAQPPLR